MKYLWYKFFRGVANIGLFFYFKKIEVQGKEHIPQNEAVLFVANHRNGLIDPVIIGTKSGKVHYYLTRASAFKNPIANFLLRSINMLPIYRMRDGVETLGKNQEIFNFCYQQLNQNRSVVIFPEGNHGLPRRLRPLSKGFTRIAFGFLEQFPKRNLYIVPVGLNYSDTLKPFQKASVYFGKPLLVNQYYPKESLNEATENLKLDVSKALQHLTVHIANNEHYETIENQLIEEGFDFTNPFETNARIATLQSENLKPQKPSQKNKNIGNEVIKTLFKINSFFPYRIWQSLKKKINDKVMISTFQYGLGLALLPLFYIVQALFIGWLMSPIAAIVYIIISVLLLFLRKKIG